MNILFLTLGYYPPPGRRTIYGDLAEELAQKGHCVYVTCTCEKPGTRPRSGKAGVMPLPVGNAGVGLRGVAVKGLLNLLLPYRVMRAVKHLKNVRFDVILCATPPVTFEKAVRRVKARDGAWVYLLLKDIFPQNAVDLGLLRKSGVTKPLYRHFREKERKLYALADFIGCMSPANAAYILHENPFLNPARVEICPNSISACAKIVPENVNIRAAFGLPEEAVVFICGGNLGRPQGVGGLIEALRMNGGKKDRFFIICGMGTEYPRLQAFISGERPCNVLLLNGLPQPSYEELLRACDVGIVSLDSRFTVPNFPSRLLSYMEYGLPVLAYTDRSTDLKDVLFEGGFGWWCENGDAAAFTAAADEICASRGELAARGRLASEYLAGHYGSGDACRTILKHFTNERDK